MTKLFITTAAIAALLLCAAEKTVFGGDALRDYTFPLGKVRELQVALMSLERKEAMCKKGGNDEPCSLPVPTCLGGTKTDCIPYEVSQAIAADLGALEPQWQFYQHAVHDLISDATGGTGALVPDSVEDRKANFKIFDLGSKPVTLKLMPVSIKAIEDAKVQVPPSTKAALAVITE